MSTTRRSIEVEGLTHGSLPIPTASRIGPFIATGGIRGVDRSTGAMPADVADQVRHMFTNLQTIIEAAGGDCGSILKLTIWIKTQDARAPINEEWIRMFPDPHARPARHILNYELGGAMLVQCEALAVVAA
jgi:2-iminobutanoate/2-iminopropanoate deaminase